MKKNKIVVKENTTGNETLRLLSIIFMFGSNNILSETSAYSLNVTISGKKHR